MKLASREQIRNIDSKTIKDYKISGLILMENAGRTVSQTICIEYPEVQKISVLCGIGNNGGDGFVIARHLINQGKDVDIYLCGDINKYNGDAKTNLTSLTKIGANIKKIKNNFANYDNSELIVDAIFGTGLDRNIKGFYKKLIEFINARKKPVVSVDIPSGLDANEGRPLGTCIKADLTVTFVLPKIGMSIYPGLEYCGKIYVSDITSPRVLENKIRKELMTGDSVKDSLKSRDDDTHKGTYGHLLIISGSPGKTGAATLVAIGSQRVGTGLTTVGIPKSLNNVMEEKLTEAMTYPLPETKSGHLGSHSLEEALKIMSDKKSALAIGPGISTSRETRDFLFELLLKCQIPIVMDADALTLISGKLDLLKKISVPLILTPHPGEMSRLSGKSTKEIQENRIAVSVDFSRKYNVYLILKGARTVISTPSGYIYINPTGNNGMASGGMGDVLTGIIGGLLAQGYKAENACKVGVFLHGLAGDISSEQISTAGYTASELANNIPGAVNMIRNAEVREFIYRAY